MEDILETSDINVNEVEGKVTFSSLESRYEAFSRSIDDIRAAVSMRDRLVNFKGGINA